MTEEQLCLAQEIVDFVLDDFIGAAKLSALLLQVLSSDEEWDHIQALIKESGVVIHMDDENFPESFSVC